MISFAPRLRAHLRSVRLDVAAEAKVPVSRPLDQECRGMEVSFKDSSGQVGDLPHVAQVPDLR